MKYASIDIGTNSCRLLIAELRNDQLTKKGYADHPYWAGLASGQISQKAAERICSTCRAFKGRLIAVGS